MGTRESNDHRNLVAVNLSLAANLVLAVARTGVGILGHSPALLADGINSTSDVVYLSIVRAFMRLAGKPPDREHPFGHHQLETVAALVIGAFVLSTGVAVFWNALREVFDLFTSREISSGAEAIALWVALSTMVLKVGLFFFTGRIAQQTGSIAVRALTRDHRNDILSIATAAVGICFGRSGYPWVDPAAAALVAVVIFNTGLKILRDSSSDLMDMLPGDRVADGIRSILEVVPGVDDVEEIHVHRIGLYLMLDVTLGIDGTLSVCEGDRIADRAEKTLRENFEYLRQVSIHYHPSRRKG
jgi:cation diffusion facilitator family transporter